MNRQDAKSATMDSRRGARQNEITDDHPNSTTRSKPRIHTDSTEGKESEKNQSVSSVKSVAGSPSFLFLLALLATWRFNLLLFSFQFEDRVGVCRKLVVKMLSGFVEGAADGMNLRRCGGRVDVAEFSGKRRGFGSGDD